MDTPTFSYREYQSTRLWQVVGNALQVLAENQDITLTTPAPYVIGYLCRQIAEAGLLPPEQLSAREGCAEP